MDFLKKLFPNKWPNTGLEGKPELDLPKEDIDNLPSETSAQNQTAPESLFNDIDKLDQIRRESDPIVENLEVGEDFSKKHSDQSTTKKVTSVEKSASIGQELGTIIQGQEQKTAKFIDSAIENNAAVENPIGSVENNKDELTVETNVDSTSKELTPHVAEIEQILTDLNDEINAPPLLSEAPKLINLGSAEFKIGPNMNNIPPKDQTACETPKVINLDCDGVRGPIVDEGTFSRDVVESKKEIQLGCAHETYENNIVIDLTQSEDEIEKNDKVCYKHPCPPEKRIYYAIVVSSKDEHRKLTADHSKAMAKTIATNLGTYATNINSVCVNPLNSLEVLNTTQLNVTVIVKTSPQEINNADVESGIMTAAKIYENTAAAQEDVNEIISISSTDDECATTNPCEDMEPDTVSCGDIEYCTEDNCTTNDPSASGNKNENTVYSDQLDTYQTCDSDSCSGYHSSDFEFITESEAERDGLIINYKRNKKPPQKRASSSVRTLEIGREPPKKNLRFEESLPGTSDSLMQHPQVFNRGDHVIPQGDQYLQMFMEYTENKSVVRNIKMHVEYEALGENMALMRKIRQQDVGNQFRDEAEETVKKILKMYPRENSKRLRRF